MDAIRVEDLREHPQWLECIAGWHQQAWQQDDLPRRIQHLQTHLVDGGLPSTLVALAGAEVIGSVSLVAYRRLGGHPPSVWLANLFVLGAQRRRGIGAALVQAAEQQARSLGLDSLMLYTHDQTDYYKKLGWQPRRQHRLAGRPTTIMVRCLG